MQRKLLILDLDHTLIYPSETEFAEAEFIIGPTYDRTWVRRRPHLEQFLNYANQHYDLAVWSASDANYVHTVSHHSRAY